MNYVLSSGFFLLAFSPMLALAQVTSEMPARPSFSQTFMSMLPLFAMVFLIFYFLVIRPQEKKLKEQKQFQESLKKGDQVVTSGGIIARVAGIEKDTILLEISSNTRLKIESSHVLKRFDKDTASSESR
jgi:preprotein translocase subunit YajC